MTCPTCSGLGLAPTGCESAEQVDGAMEACRDPWHQSDELRARAADALYTAHVAEGQEEDAVNICWRAFRGDMSVSKAGASDA